MPLTQAIGGVTIGGLAYLGNLTRLTAEAARAVLVDPFRGRKFRWSRSLHQALMVGVRAIPIVSMISFFVGLIFALQAAYELRRLGALHLVAGGGALSLSPRPRPPLAALLFLRRSPFPLSPL